MKDDEKSKYSDYVVENNSSELELFSKIDQIITKII
jgi:dephospho-CoA kinase